MPRYPDDNHDARGNRRGQPYRVADWLFAGIFVFMMTASFVLILFTSHHNWGGFIALAALAWALFRLPGNE